MRNYEMSLFQVETMDGLEWVAEYRDLKGCVGGGATYEEAIKEAEENKTIYLEYLQSIGKPAPIPHKHKETSASGRISLRISKSLHSEVAKMAELDEISINQFITEAVSERVGAKKAINSFEEAISCVTKTISLSDDSSIVPFIKQPKRSFGGAAYYGKYMC